MALCWRLFHKHSAMKTIRMRTITPSTQPTMRYNISLLLAELVAGPTCPPCPEELGGVLKSLTGYSEAPGTRFTGWNIKKRKKMKSEWIQSLWNGLSEGGLAGEASWSVYTPHGDDMTTSESQGEIQNLKFWSARVLVLKFLSNSKSQETYKLGWPKQLYDDLLGWAHRRLPRLK